MSVTLTPRSRGAGRHLVLAQRLALFVFVAAVVSGCSDTLQISGDSGNEVGVLVDGQDAGGAVNDRGFLTNAASVGVGNLSAGPTNESVGFTNRRPPRYRETPWTDGGDSLPMDFQPEIQIPVTVWIVKGPFADQRDHAIDACIQTSAIFNAERMGVSFSSFQIIDATGDPDAPAHHHFPNGDQGDVVWAPLRNDIGFTAGRLNIYWVDTVNGSTTTGWSNFGAQVAMGRNTGDELLSHEIGHAFSLTHINGLATFDQTNVMHNASNTREFFTEAQLFRAHLDPDSILNDVYNARPGELTRNCGLNTANATCPAIGRRLWADGAFPAN